VENNTQYYIKHIIKKQLRIIYQIIKFQYYAIIHKQIILEFKFTISFLLHFYFHIETPGANVILSTKIHYNMVTGITNTVP